MQQQLDETLAGWFATFSILYGSMVGATYAGMRIQSIRDDFQYPLRIDGRCNRQQTTRPSPQSPLSVSSTDRWSVQQHPPDRAVQQPLTFSILYGSMVGATRVRGCAARGYIDFQYPLRIDGRCNHPQSSPSPRTRSLSVSSTDRWSVQHKGYSSSSTMYEILSVSSTDRWSVQLPPPAASGSERLRFQYPLRIDGRCNSGRARPAHRGSGTLSVSSTDRWSVQQQRAHDRRYGRRSFQYPLRIDGRCNSCRTSTSTSSPMSFQYPLRIDGRCNSWSFWERLLCCLSFSILYGSMVGATPRVLLRSRTSPPFQYPLRIDGRCNRVGELMGKRVQMTFSILYGSMVGATDHEFSRSLIRHQLSVSSTDRWSVQQETATFIVQRENIFQYPLRIDGRCNWPQMRHTGIVIILSVSSTDRWSVQPGMFGTSLET